MCDSNTVGLGRKRDDGLPLRHPVDTAYCVPGAGDTKKTCEMLVLKVL